jgi:hypothetical protein
MSKLEFLVALVSLVAGANGFGQSAATDEAKLPRLVADCNGAANSPKPRAMRACERLENAGRLSLVESAARTAYQRYRDERLEACQRRQASPRGQSRGESGCGR